MMIIIFWSVLDKIPQLAIAEILMWEIRSER